MEKLLKSAEVEELLQLSRCQIWKLTRSGELPAVRIGRSLRFRRSDVDGFVSRKATAA